MPILESDKKKKLTHKKATPALTRSQWNELIKVMDGPIGKFTTTAPAFESKVKKDPRYALGTKVRVKSLNAIGYLYLFSSAKEEIQVKFPNTGVSIRWVSIDDIELPAIDWMEVEDAE